MIELDGQEIRDRSIAGELINRHAARIFPNSEERVIGTFAGFNLSVAGSIFSGTQVLLKGAALHQAKVSDTALGTMRSIEYAVQNLGEVVCAMEKEMSDAQRRLADLKGQCGKPFEYAARLSELRKRQQEIEESLDLTKNQASSRLASDSSEEESTSREEGAMSLREMGFPEYEY